MQLALFCSSVGLNSMRFLLTTLMCLFLNLNLDHGTLNSLAKKMVLNKVKGFSTFSDLFGARTNTKRGI